MVLNALSRAEEPGSSGAADGLLLRAKTGDLDAFEQLVRRHERQVFALALRFAGQVEDAKDATQEAFIRLHRHLDRIDSTRSLAAWLGTTVVNACRDIARQRRRSRIVSIDESAAVARDPAAGPEELASSQQFEERLRNGLKRLSEKERSALLLREMEGLSTAEVSRILGSSEVTVRSQVSNARLKLRKLLGREGKR